MRYRITIGICLLGVMFFGLIIMYRGRSGMEGQTEGKLFLHSGGGLRLAVNECVEIFSEEFGAEVECNYAGRRGDLFMPGDVSYIDRVEPPDLVESKHTVCYFIPTILVRKGNPKNIRTIEDLARPGTILGLGNPEVCAIGRMSVQIFEKNSIDMAEIEKNLVFSSVTVGELGVQIQIGKVDAVVVWDATAAQYADSGDIVKIPTDQNVISTVAIALLDSSENKPLAGEFIDFTISERGQAVFRKHNFSTELPE
ncbi:substrate-binding domain-containing protein [Candidatus Poribacteria bacterium]